MIVVTMAHATRQAETSGASEACSPASERRETGIPARRERANEMAPQREWFEKDYYAELGVSRTRPRRRSRAPTGSWRSSSTPTPTPVTRPPRSASRRSPPRTTCSVTPRSARSTTRSARWSRPASGPVVRAASAAAGPRRVRWLPERSRRGPRRPGRSRRDLRQPVRRRRRRVDVVATRDPSGPSGATTSRPSCTSTSSTRCTASPRR